MYLIDTNIHAAYLLQNFETDAHTKQYLACYSQMKLAERVIPDFILGKIKQTGLNNRGVYSFWLSWQDSR